MSLYHLLLDCLHFLQGSITFWDKVAYGTQWASRVNFTERVSLGGEETGFQTLSWGIFLTFQTRGELWNVTKINCNWELDAERRQRSPSACWAVLAINHKITGQNFDSLNITLLNTNAFHLLQWHAKTLRCWHCLTVTAGWKIRLDISQAWFLTEKLSLLP